MHIFKFLIYNFLNATVNMGITNTIFLAGLALTSSVTASHPKLLDTRAVGDACTGTHGDGTCQSTSGCKGISYEDPFCPDDPDGIQVGRFHMPVVVL